MNRLIGPALEGFPVAWFAPQYKYLLEPWRDFLRTLKPVISRSDATERRIELVTGGVLDFWTLEDEDAGRSRKYKRAIVDEAGKVKNLETAWNEAIRPTLADYRGDADLYGTPKGANFFYKCFQWGNDPAEHDWASFRMPTSANPFIDPGEIEALRRQLSERAFRQEILAEFLFDVGGALWKLAELDEHRVNTAPEMRRIVVALDPATTSNADSDETGIVVAGVGRDGRGYVLADRTVRATPRGWAEAAVSAYRAFKADRIVYESNQGGDMVKHTLETVDRNIPLKAVHASRGKQTRAEPVAALYEKGQISHVGHFSKLEDQLITWVPGDPSPDRLDAAVWALTELMIPDVPYAGPALAGGNRPTLGGRMAGPSTTNRFR